VGNGRKAREIAGKWKQYSGRKLPDFFPMDSGQFPVLSGWEMTEIHWKKIDQFPTGLLLPLSSAFRAFQPDTVIFPHLSGRFLRYPSSGIIDLGSGLNIKWS
jgi:hypothetical protein